MTTAVDLFAGLGGWSEGARAAGVRVVWAANHWQTAVKYHKLAHPETDHACQDLQQADFRTVPRSDWVLASPACQGHTPARGRERAHHDALRSTAWAVVTAAEVCRPEIVVVENVPGFRGWVLYPAWCAALNALGYSLAEHVIDAADLGVPQNRERLFVVASRSLAPLRLALPRREHVAAETVIEWDRYAWAPVAGHARVERARRDVGPRCLMPYYGSGSGLTGRSLSRPLGTVTTLDRWAILDGDRMRMLQPSELRRAMGFPETTQLPPDRRTAIKLLGNAVCPPVAEAIARALLGAHLPN